MHSTGGYFSTSPIERTLLINAISLQSFAWEIFFVSGNSDLCFAGFLAVDRIFAGNGSIILISPFGKRQGRSP